ncbi:MAG: hypothetical protein PUB37_00485 [Firmicutes bacterium]|nr:hypothetical protein [Bacillota bacterium]
MFAEFYDILMHTPLGDKHGKIMICVKDWKISGSLDLLGHCEPFCGTIDSDGNCTFSGTLITLMHTIHYTASGVITSQLLNLSLNDGKHVFKVTGFVCPTVEEHSV